MAKHHEGKLEARGLRMAFVVSRFNELFTDRLLNGALDCARRHGAAEEDLHVIHVPGAFEVPVAAQQAARSAQFDAIVCLAVVIRGATPHFDLVAGEVANGVSRVALDTGLPVTFGVLTTESLEQAMERSGSKGGNKGWEASLAAVEMANLLRDLKDSPH